MYSYLSFALLLLPFVFQPRFNAELRICVPNADQVHVVLCVCRCVVLTSLLAKNTATEPKHERIVSKTK